MTSPLNIVLTRNIHYVWIILTTVFLYLIMGNIIFYRVSDALKGLTSVICGRGQYLTKNGF